MERAHYIAACRKRWGGIALRDAKRNWTHWQEVNPLLIEPLRTYHRNPYLEDMAGKQHNPDGTLTAMLWKLQGSLEPDRGCLDPLLDFEEHFQKVFLRRGLIIYCELLLAEMAAPPLADPNQHELRLA